MPLLVAAVIAVQPVHPAALQEVLAAMDKAGPEFRDLSANLKRVQYTAILKESEESRGLVRLRRESGRDMRMLVELKQPEETVVSFQKNEVQKYYPKLSLVEIYELGKLRSVVDQFLLLGFGSTGMDLQRNYSLKEIGEETIGGQVATRLELAPTAPAVQEYLKKAELWVAPAGHPVQQKVYTSASGDYFLFSYSDIKINSGLPESAVRLQLPANVKRERRK